MLRRVGIALDDFDGAIALNEVLGSSFAPLRGVVVIDICIVGAGYTGLSAALHLAERGYDVVVLEAHRVGFAASERNLGQLGSGQRVNQQTLENFMGVEDGKLLWELGEESKYLVKSLVAHHQIGSQLKPDIVDLALTVKK